MARMEWLGMTLPDMADMARHDMTWLTWHGTAWHIMAWHGMAWHGFAWHDMALHGMAWHSMAWHGMTWRGMAWHGTTWLAPAPTRLVANLRPALSVSIAQPP